MEKVKIEEKTIKYLIFNKKKLTNDSYNFSLFFRFFINFFLILIKFLIKF